MGKVSDLGSLLKLINNIEYYLLFILIQRRHQYSMPLPHDRECFLVNFPTFFSEFHI